MLPWPILLAGGAVLAWIVLSPAGPAGPAQAPAPPVPPPPYQPPPGQSTSSGDGNDAVPPFTSGF